MLQQKANELVLLQEHYAKIFGRHLGQDVAHNPVRLLRGAMLTASLLADVLASMDTAILERTADGSFRLLSKAPKWLICLYPETATRTEGLWPGQEFPFLENFLIDAEQFWQAGSPGHLKSGPWTEVDSAGHF